MYNYLPINCSDKAHYIWSLNNKMKDNKLNEKINKTQIAVCYMRKLYKNQVVINS